MLLDILVIGFGRDIERERERERESLCKHIYLVSSKE